MTPEQIAKVLKQNAKPEPTRTSDSISIEAYITWKNICLVFSYQLLALDRNFNRKRFMEECGIYE